MPAVTQKTFSKGSTFPPLDDGTLRCYSMRFCPFAQRARLVLAHKEIPHEIVNITLRPVTEKPDWFLERNPLGLVPVLEQDGKIIYESAVCCEYLDDTYPGNRLTPADAYRRARDRMILELYGKMISAYYKILMSRGSDNEAIENYIKAAEPIEKALAERGKFFGGDTVTMLDYYVWPWIERLPVLKLMFQKDILTTEKFPNLHAWIGEMMKVPAVQKCYFKPEQHAAFYMSAKDGSPNYDFGLE